MDERTDMEFRKRKRRDMDETSNKRCAGTKEEKQIAPFPNPNLPYDIIFKILLKLPQQPLAPFKSVSKEFKAVITDPAFIARRRPSFIIQAPRLSFRTIPGPLFKHFNIAFLNVEEITIEIPKEMPQHLCLVGSCHGLLCFRKYLKEDHIHYVYNSLTKRWNFTPPVQASIWGNFHVLYYKSSTNTYQLLTHVSEESNGFKGYKVHELGTASWRAVSETDFSYVPFKTTSVAMFGCLYWICSSRTQHENCVIVAFDVEKEQISYIKEPPGEELPSDDSDALTLVETDAGLGYPTFTPCTMDIWVMRDRNEAWEKVYVVNLEPIQGSLEISPSSPSYVVLMGTLGEIWFLDHRHQHEGGKSKLTVYDCNCHTFRSIDLWSLIPECYTRVIKYCFCQWKSPISLNAFCNENISSASL